MNRTELIAEVAERSGLTKKDAEKAVVALFDTVIDEVAAGNKVQIVGFGTFEQRIRKEREGISPRTKEKMIIPEAKVPAFKPGRSFKEAVNK